MNYFPLRTHRTILLTLVLLLPILVSACGGYRFAADHNTLPEDIRSISISFLKNETFESNIEAYFTNALINEFIKNKQFTVLPHGGDVTLSGVVKDFRTAPIAYSGEDRAQEYRAFVEMELTLTRNDTGEVVWRNPRLVHDEEYSVGSTIAFTDAGKKAAIQKIATELAEQIYEELILGF
ncbi:MAG: LptE family protein [Pseudomonadota bacterium]